MDNLSLWDIYKLEIIDSECDIFIWDCKKKKIIYEGGIKQIDLNFDKKAIRKFTYDSEIKKLYIYATENIITKEIIMIYSDSLDDMVVKGFYYQNSKYIWDDDDCIYYDEDTEDYFMCIPKQAVLLTT